MALTRKMLQAMDIPAEKIDEIITAHSETVTALKTERDELKAQADRLPDVEKALEKAQTEVEQYKTGDWEKKYNDLKSEYDTFRTDTETKAVKASKKAAYRKLLVDSGISAKRIDSILRVSDIDSIELDKDGNLADSDKLAENIKTEWADFIATEEKKGAEIVTPPENTGGEIKQPSRAAQMAAKFHNERYGNSEKED